MQHASSLSSLACLGSNRHRLVSEEFSAEPPSVAVSSKYQSEAAAALSDYSNEDIFAWLKLVRSAHNIEPIPEPPVGGAYLSPSQIQALVTLKDCPNDRLNNYLVLARLNRNGLISAASATRPSVALGLSNNLSSFLRSSGPSLFETGVQQESSQQDPSSPNSDPYEQRQLATNDLDPFGHHASRSVNLNLSTPAENHYWCTVCEVPNSYKDSGSWKKHEKEHETRFVCERCDVAHKSMVDRSPDTKVFSSKRRDIMVNHMNKSHGIAVQAGRDLADQWRITVKKQAWSCGFCGSLFLDFKDRLRHIDIEHFRKYECMQQWDLNKILHGLLLQPKMENAWKKRTAMIPWVQPEDLTWTEAFAKNMRPKLEIGPSDESDANCLADEIYSAGNPKRSLNESATAPRTVFPASIAGASPWVSPNQHQTVTAPPSGSAPDHSRRRSIMHATVNIYGDWPFDQSPRHADDLGNRAAPSSAALEEGPQGTYHTESFYPTQDWVAESEGGNGCSSFDDALSEGNQGFTWPTPDWNV